ncbi:MAG: peptide deformylase [Bacteroidales bacterium]|nr:peptide deformylase [Bacteroidales bacterium]
MKKHTLSNLSLLMVLFLAIGFSACKKEDTTEPTPDPIPVVNQYEPWTQAEIDLIMSGEADEPMRILVTSNEEDSLFLTKQTIPIEPDANDPILIRLRERMIKTMIDGGGVGIAGPQVGISRALFWCKRFDLEDKPFQFIINPKILFYSVKMITFLYDGCLSIPDYTGSTATRRHSSIFVEYYTQDGIKEQNILEGTSSSNFTAVCFQHEYDHLQGILFPERLNVP